MSQRLQSCLIACAMLLFAGVAAAAQQVVHFPSAGDNGPGRPSTTLDGYLFRPAAAGRLRALVFLHGCGGMFSRQTGFIDKRDAAWAGDLVRQGFVVLMVDSFRARNQGEMCSVSGFDLSVYDKRPADAYGALLYLRAQPFVRADRIGLIGWSQGGGVVLDTIGVRSRGRPRSLPQGDFGAAVAFYPGRCRESAHDAAWRSTIPLLVLVGALDVWSPAIPCQSFLAAAAARGSPIALQVYPGAYHDFDWPAEAVHPLPADRTRAGIVPIAGTNPAARADALVRVPSFLAQHLAQ